ncbi:unnamed protein product, partial [Nesidiocoris tenuis]
MKVIRKLLRKRSKSMRRTNHRKCPCTKKKRRSTNCEESENLSPMLIYFDELFRSEFCMIHSISCNALWTKSGSTRYKNASELLMESFLPGSFTYVFSFNFVHAVNVSVQIMILRVSHENPEAQVILTVQQSPLPLRERSGSTVMPSPSLLRQPSCQSRDRITAPQPVDNEKLRQFEYQKAHTLKLMLEKEQRYVESLRSKRAKCNDSGTEARILQDLQGAERRILTLQTQLEQEYFRGVVPLPNLERITFCEHSPKPIVVNDATGANQVHTHQRTKSSPDTMSPNAALAEASKRLIASESMSELSIAKRSKGGVAWEVDRPTSPSTPPGTPPPPYNMGFSAIDETVYSHIPEEDSPPRGEVSTSETDHAATSPTKNFNFLAPGSPPIQQQPIISMEDEDMSDQEMSQMEDHGPFKRWNELSKHQAHLAVFLNYVISNSDPSSILFYLVTDLYKEGSAKEMKKWAYEIHSSFLVPGAPLRLNNVDENVAREIDEVLLKESDKEEILRKIFWKARQKAKEELNEQLADFQAKRTAGLGTLFGPKDAELEESIHDKNKEMRIIESVLVPKLEPYLRPFKACARGTRATRPRNSRYLFPST